MRFQDRVAIVTGGAGGIGRATCLRLAEEGATVVVADIDADAARTTAAELATPGLAVQVDVGSPDSARELAATVTDVLGRVDVLVNNAGCDTIGPFADSDPATWQRLLTVNLMGTIACTHAVLPSLIEQGEGAIVCVASDAGRVGSSGEVVYSATKGGVIAFGKALAREVARHRIRVNSVAPGPTDTPFLNGFGGDLEKILNGMIRATPLRSLAQPEQIAAAIAFLASADADFITGQTVSVSGGLTMV
ncbi:2-hydroxycyclohexanecarboxyl-CoA dehydrogenase [Prauserella sp. PE36]|uniref:Glucose 1-dehydrogenase n=1 Tax=Prauserella endophytica TaxID=1592324 RepID=A0ABY2S471_9PSEU|nr:MULTISPECIES: glucose 1-dehydrogenase [Prauserella]PXY23483.1 2-hydroxycyclohexanecarboxyl-CoA dehydrogenase [Prauserella coralliicola]RBM18326.1 2-hydroxycyclohexanecarboxyl-CoA dehydrogenase [Prauserella sp. PE36]TKG70531.1 glucose 1-dehydrogenase [Prauserella endophytica]